MKKLYKLLQVLVWCGALFFIASAPFRAYSDEATPCAMAEDAIRQAARIRGLAVKRKVKCVLQDREQVKNHILGVIAEKMPRGRLELEGLVYEALGFIPDGYSYKEGVMEMYLGQIGGYYDPAKKRYVMAAWLPVVMQMAVAVHELTHALQDQHYDLEAMIDMKKYTSDELMARMALLEGDATAVMLDYGRRLAGQGALAAEKGVESIMLQNLIGAALVGTGQNVPSSLVAMLVFPYTSGLRFVHGFLREGGYQALGKVYLNPPTSTREVLHPEVYLQGRGAVRIRDEEFRPPRWPGAKVVYRDTLGEFSVSVLLGEFNKNVVQNSLVAAGWRGDRVVVWRAKENGPVEVAWRVVWESGLSAAQFLEIYKKGLESRYTACAWEEVEKKWVKALPTKRIRLKREGRVTVVRVRK